MAHKSNQHQHLIYSKEVLEAIKSDKTLQQDSNAMRKLADELDALNDHGTNREYHSPGSLENLGSGWWSLRVRSQHNFWRIIFVKANKDEYGLVIKFLKKENKITKKNWADAKRVAKREGWI